MLVKKSIEFPLYRGIFIVMFADHKVKIANHYDDLNSGYKLDYAHFFCVNHKNYQLYLFKILSYHPLRGG